MTYFDIEFRKKLYEKKLAAGLAKVQLHESKLEEEVLKTALDAKSFSIGDKVRILKGEMQGKIGSINYCNAGKCVVRIGSDQIFLDVCDIDNAAEKPLDEVTESMLNEDDDIQVKVDGEVVADTSTDEIESGEMNIQATDTDSTIEEFGAKLGLTDMLLQAVNDENTTIQYYNNLIAACNDEGFNAIADVIKHINEEENIHVGMLQYAISTISDQAKTIGQGEKEAADIMSGNEDAAHEDTLTAED